MYVPFLCIYVTKSWSINVKYFKLIHQHISIIFMLMHTQRVCINGRKI